MSYLTTSIDGLAAEVIVDLEGEGFDFNPLTISFSRYLATALGQPNSYLTKSIPQMLAEIDAQYGGSLSYLRSSVAQLLDDLAANIDAGGGGGDVPSNALTLNGQVLTLSGQTLTLTV
jgi:hypothetical protein